LETKSVVFGSIFDRSSEIAYLFDSMKSNRQIVIRNDDKPFNIAFIEDFVQEIIQTANALEKSNLYGKYTHVKVNSMESASLSDFYFAFSKINKHNNGVILP
jgi:hypothetical protein